MTLVSVIGLDLLELGDWLRLGGELAPDDGVLGEAAHSAKLISTCSAAFWCPNPIILQRLQKNHNVDV